MMAHNLPHGNSSRCDLADQTHTCDVLLIGYENQENLGLRSIAAFLTQHGVRVTIEPCQQASHEAILAAVRAGNPKIVGFSLIFQRMLPDFADLIAYLRSHGVNAHFTMGGHFATLEPAEVLRTIPELDTVVRHEGELTLLELYGDVNQPAAWERIQGLAFRRNSEITVTAARPLIQNLDVLPYATRSGRSAKHRNVGICSISASRGCYYNCSFCSIQEFYREPSGPKRRSRSPAHVAAEMEELFNDLGIKVFIFQDDDFQMKGRSHRQWVEAFLDELAARNLMDNILWRISCRIDDLDRAMLLRMRQAGLVGVYLGIESGSNQGLLTFNKHYCVDDVYRALAMLAEVNVPYEYGFMILEPYSTLTTLRENINFLQQVSQDGAALANFCKTAPYAGTPITQQLVAEDRLKGTLAAPDYRFLDSRLDLFQLFLSQTFNYRNFAGSGLVERLRFAKFDCALLDRFFPGKYDTRSYARAIHTLIRQCNESALQTLSLAARLVQTHSEAEIIDYWPLLRGWQQDEWETELRIDAALDQLLVQYGFDTQATDSSAWYT
jgi:anaerobic magnesium-protoporphyrin IX monomethyl ester cyclase